jgi:hypothetical protein
MISKADVYEWQCQQGAASSHASVVKLQISTNKIGTSHKKCVLIREKCVLLYCSPRLCIRKHISILKVPVRAREYRSSSLLVVVNLHIRSREGGCTEPRSVGTAKRISS